MSAEPNPFRSLATEDLIRSGAARGLMAVLRQNEIFARQIAALREQRRLLEEIKSLNGGTPSMDEPAPHQWSSIQEIIDEVSARYGLAKGGLIGPCRRRRFAWPRQEAYYLCRSQLTRDGEIRFSYPLIGRHFGGRDHTTVLHGVGAYAARNNLPIPTDIRGRS